MNDGTTLHWLTGKTSRACVWILGIGAFLYLLGHHGEHARSWLPYLALLACPLMHVFMHRHHKHGGHHE